jgi:SSS family solute:Na+ symporter
MPAPATFGTLNYIVLFVYLLAIFAIGLKMAGKQKNTEDYFLAGRKMPWIVVCLSMFASLTSAISFMGIPALSFRENISFIGAAVVGPIAAPFIIMIFYPFYHRLKVTTSYEYIYHRFGMAGRIAASSLFIVGRLVWLGAVIYTPSLALSVTTGVNLYVAIVLMGLVACLYTTIGGLSAVLWTDVIQFILLIGGAIWATVSIISNVPGGVTEIFSIAQAKGNLGGFEWGLNLTKMTIPIVAVGTFIGLMDQYGSDQITVQRLLAVKNFRGIVKAILLNSVFDVFILTILCFLGLGLLAYYTHFPSDVITQITADENDGYLPYYIITVLPAGISGVVIAAIFAAAMSSMDSGIHSLSTVIVNDFVKPLRKVSRTDHHDLSLARILTFVLGAIGIIVACFFDQLGGIFKALGILGVYFTTGVLSIFLLGIFCKRVTFDGWLTGFIVSSLTTVYIQQTDIHFTYYYPIAIVVCVLSGYISSVIITLCCPEVKGSDKYTIWKRSELNADSKLT